MSIREIQNNKGFTLIELLVSIGIFTIVVVIALGAIVTIIDANRKARSLTTVMNNLNFTLEGMTRSIKTGTGPVRKSDGTLCVMEIDPSKPFEGDFLRRAVEYKLNNGSIQRRVYITESAPGGHSCVSPPGPGVVDIDFTPITSIGVNIGKFDVQVFDDIGRQPRVKLILEGEVKVNEKIKSDFTIQTTVSQRKLIN